MPLGYAISLIALVGFAIVIGLLTVRMLRWHEPGSWQRRFLLVYLAVHIVTTVTLLTACRVSREWERRLIP